MATKVCVTIAASSPTKVSSELRGALAKSEYAELRLDFLKPNQIPFCLTLVRKHLKRCICTLRPIAEGGKFSGSEKERISILKLISEFEPYLIDVEYNTLKKNKELVKYLKSRKTRMLVSWHDFAKTPNEHTLRSMFKKMSKYSNNIKIVTMAKTIDDTIRILSLYKISTRKINLISFAMGDYGRMSRILCTKLGSPYTYVSLGKPVAPGQFSLKEMKSILSLEDKN
ncbi:3-dehydroquinate dehydratase [Nitrosotalea devaniterrae]|uniref:3-dehydroquinate dehydratase n=1 Tax=Nitrosotalea devaniterrae TaxID=1078905 RepID=A0A128A1V3_9ARCH|nr:3-dehydroquinate dehydratase [Candidatus Nitrosotalea devanaterra]